MKGIEVVSLWMLFSMSAPFLILVGFIFIEALK